MTSCHTCHIRPKLLHKRRRRGRDSHCQHQGGVSRCQRHGRVLEKLSETGGQGEQGRQGEVQGCSGERDTSSTSASFPLTTSCVPLSHALAAPSADIPLHRRRSIAYWVAMPPKKVSFKAPAASSPPSNPIAPPDDPAARLRSLLANTRPLSQDVGPAPTRPTLPSIPTVATLQAEVDQLKDERDMLTSLYREKSSELKELSRSHNALQDKLARLTEQLARVSAQVTSTVAAPAAVIPEPSPRLLTKDLASCAVQTDLIMTTADIMPKPPVKKSFAQAAKAPAPKPSAQPDEALSHLATTRLAPSRAGALPSQMSSTSSCILEQPSILPY